jgi:hypothetical protein
VIRFRQFLDTRKNVNWLETTFLVIFGMSLFSILTFVSGGPIYWDDLLYMHSALNNTPEPTIIGRYTHVYLLKLFYTIVGGNPFLGARLMWAFLISATCLIIYLIARLLYPSQSRFTQSATGTLAVIIFLSSPFLKIAGPVLSDISVMFFISLGLWVYLLAIKIPASENRLLILFGFILFLAINSKEVGIVLLELLIGWGFQANNQFDLKSWKKKLLWVFLGALSGLGFFIVMDKFFIGDLWFHLRFTNWKIWFFFNTDQPDAWSSLNYFSFISSTMLLPVTILAYQFP